MMVAFSIFKRTFPLAPSFCVIWVTMDVLLCTASIWHMCTMSMDRYFTLWSPMKYGRNRTKSRVALKIMFVWVISILICIALPIRGFTNYANVYNNGECVPVMHSFLISGSVFAFYLPLTIMGVTYYLTVRILRKNLQNNFAGKNGQRLDSSSASPRPQSPTDAECGRATVALLAAPKFFPPDVASGCTITSAGVTSIRPSIEESTDTSSPVSPALPLPSASGTSGASVSFDSNVSVAKYDSGCSQGTEGLNDGGEHLPSANSNTLQVAPLPAAAFHSSPCLATPGDPARRPSSIFTSPSRIVRSIMHRHNEDGLDHDIENDDSSNQHASETKKKKKKQTAFKLLDLEYFEDDVDSVHGSDEEDRETFTRQGAFRRKESSMTRNCSDLEAWKKKIDNNSSIQPLLPVEKEPLEVRLKRKWNVFNTGSKPQKIVSGPDYEYPTGLRSKATPRTEGNGTGLRSKVGSNTGNRSVGVRNKSEDLRVGLRSKFTVNNDDRGFGLRSKSFFNDDSHATGLRSKSVPQSEDLSVGLRSKPIPNTDETIGSVQGKTTPNKDERGKTKSGGSFKGLRKRGSKKWTIMPEDNDVVKNDIKLIIDNTTCNETLQKNCDICGTLMITGNDCSQSMQCISCQATNPRQIKRDSSFGFFRSNPKSPDNIATNPVGDINDQRIQQPLMKDKISVRSDECILCARSLPMTNPQIYLTSPHKPDKEQSLPLLLPTSNENKDIGHQINGTSLEAIPECFTKGHQLNDIRTSNDRLESNLSKHVCTCKTSAIEKADNSCDISNEIQVETELTVRDKNASPCNDECFVNIENHLDNDNIDDIVKDDKSHKMCPSVHNSQTNLKAVCIDTECATGHQSDTSGHDSNTKNQPDVILHKVTIVEISSPHEKSGHLHHKDSSNITSSTTMSEMADPYSISPLTFASSPNIGEVGQQKKPIFSSMDAVHQPHSPTGASSPTINPVGKDFRRPSVPGRKPAVTRRRRANEQKASNVLSIIVTVFVVTWLPFFTLNIVSVFCESCTMSMMSDAAAAFVWFGYMSSLANPIICTMFSTSFRTVFFKILTCQYQCGGKASRRARSRGVQTRGCCGLSGGRMHQSLRK